MPKVSMVFNPAPGWPPAPDGWLPWAGWAPNPEWPAAPEGWQIVIPATAEDREKANRDAAKGVAKAGEREAKDHAERTKKVDKAQVATIQTGQDALVEAESPEDAAPIRPDIDAALERMGRTLGVKRELRRLVNQLEWGETVADLGRIKRNGHGCLLVVTNTRLIFLREGMVRSMIEDVPVRMLTTVAVKRRLTNGDLLVTVANNKEIWHMTSASHCERVAATMRSVMRRIGAPVTHTVISTAPVQADAYDQLRKLGELRDAGVLSTAEFDAKKAEILARV